MPVKAYFSGKQLRGELVHKGLMALVSANPLLSEHKCPYNFVLIIAD
jgi:hypothetical protein